jgi:hypothetical protein
MATEPGGGDEPTDATVETPRTMPAHVVQFPSRPKHSLAALKLLASPDVRLAIERTELMLNRLPPERRKSVIRALAKRVREEVAATKPQAHEVVAWAPNLTDPAVHLSAVWSRAGVRILDNDDLLARIGERLQAAINLDEDPQDLADAAVRQLWDAGLLPDSASVPWQFAGSALIGQNMAVRERLAAWSALLDLTECRSPECLECVPARIVLDEERSDPRSSVERWLSLISRLP